MVLIGSKQVLKVPVFNKSENVQIYSIPFEGKNNKLSRYVTEGNLVPT